MKNDLHLNQHQIIKNSYRFALFVGLLLSNVDAAPIAHYDMEQTGSPLVDQVGGQQAVAIGSGHAYSVTGPSGFGNAVNLSANGSWQLSAEDSAELRALANNFTVASWVYLEPGRYSKVPVSGISRDRIIGDDVAWDKDGWSFGIETDATGRRMQLTKNGVVDIWSGYTTLIGEGVWTHLAVTITTSGVNFYINGTLLGTNANTQNVIITDGNNGSPDAYAIGRASDNESEWFPGRLDDVRVYDHVLNAAEVAELLIPPGNPSGFPGWAAENGIPNDPDYDGADQDGIAALIEYALGYDPNVKETLPQMVPTGGGAYTVTWPKGAEAAADSSLHYNVRISDDLSEWVEPAPADLSESGTQIMLTLPAGQTRIFARLGVTRSVP